MKPKFTKNFHLKVFSLLVALLLEMYFHSPDNSVMDELPGKLIITNLPPQRVIVEPVNGDKGIPVQVTVKGPSSVVSRLKTKVSEFQIEAPANSQGQFIMDLDPRSLSLPASVEALEITHQELTFVQREWQPSNWRS